MCEGTASSLPYDPPADPSSETREQRIARKIIASKAKGTWGVETAPPAPSLTDAAVQEAATSAAQRTRMAMARGRRSTMLTPGSIGDTSTLLGA